MSRVAASRKLEVVSGSTQLSPPTIPSLFSGVLNSSLFNLLRALERPSIACFSFKIPSCAVCAISTLDMELAFDEHQIIPVDMRSP